MSETENMSKIVALNLIISLTMLIVTSGIDHRGAHEPSRMKKLSYIMIIMIVIWLHTFSKAINLCLKLAYLLYVNSISRMLSFQLAVQQGGHVKDNHPGNYLKQMFNICLV